MIFSAQMILNLLIGREDCTTKQISVHFLKTLHLLRERLSSRDEYSKISDLTILVVLTLATYAHIMGDSDNARHHLEGLQKIVQLRGGIFSLMYNTKLLLEVFR
jgi:hypothetical protein